ncbi:MAG: hypothetical protein KGI57_00780 [Hyphomicrobiales bacterium]|nr:hypothetical protein [Hyphomicrobiales bacterium]MDE2016220.1 hypothetical protein [Hyphomicrobiales bacterium]
MKALMLAALAAFAALESSAYALNPQPLPPGAHAPSTPSGASPAFHEPPDPCFSCSNARALNPQPLPPG